MARDFDEARGDGRDRGMPVAFRRADRRRPRAHGRRAMVPDGPGHRLVGSLVVALTRWARLGASLTSRCQSSGRSGQRSSWLMLSAIVVLLIVCRIVLALWLRRPLRGRRR